VSRPFRGVEIEISLWKVPEDWDILVLAQGTSGWSRKKKRDFVKSARLK
jgi:hypothetical protein